MLGEGLHLVFGGPDASPVHGVFPKPEFVTAEHDPFLPTSVRYSATCLKVPSRSVAYSSVSSITLFTSLTPRVILLYLWV